MKELVVISGKGGTGKTSLMAAFASLAKNKVLCDADVNKKTSGFSGRRHRGY